jgi:hypothetical protein
MCMPKLTEAQRYEKLREQLTALKAGKEVEARKMKTILTDVQLKAINDKWKEQLDLREKVKAKTKEQQQAAGYKSKRDVQIEVYEDAVHALDPLAVLQKELKDKEVKRAKIYMKSYTTARKEGKEKYQSESIANNDLTRAHLRRYDGVDNKYRNKRDKEVFELEAQLKKQLGIKDSEDEEDT